MADIITFPPKAMNLEDIDVEKGNVI